MIEWGDTLFSPYQNIMYSLTDHKTASYQPNTVTKKPKNRKKPGNSPFFKHQKGKKNAIFAKKARKSGIFWRFFYKLCIFINLTNFTNPVQKGPFVSNRFSATKSYKYTFKKITSMKKGRPN